MDTKVSPVGMIGMACGETARYSECYASLMGITKPPGTAFIQSKSMSVADNFNRIARSFLRTDAQWLFLVNDDQVWAPNTLTKLLTHDVDVVTGLYLSRMFPFAPICYDQVSDMGLVHSRYLLPGEAGLIPIKACGDGCLLIRRKVLEAIPDPWWELGNPQKDMCCHDVLFSKKVNDAGFQIYADLEVTVGHLALFSVFPHRNPQGVWTTLLVQAGGNIVLPSVQSPLNPYTLGGPQIEEIRR
jgi:hypothetical protein